MIPPQDPSAAPPGDANRRVTMRDIARRLGVSHVTVSYALRGLPRVSEKLRQRIRAEALKLGYREDPMLQALCVYRKASRGPEIRAALAWLCCWDPPEELHTRKEFHAYWLGVNEVAARHGYRVESFSPGGRLSLARIQQILHARSIRGILVPPPQSTFKQALDGFDWGKFSVVKFGHAHAGLRSSLVTSAHVFNAALAIERMTALGYRRIGFVTSDYSRRHTQFLGGVLRAQAELPAENRVPFLSLPEDDIHHADPASLSRWIEREKPDAILTNMREVPGMVRQLGLRIPEDMPVAAMSVHDGNSNAGIDQNPLEIGRAACEVMVANLLHGHFGLPAHPRELLIEGSWVDGAMLPARRRDDVAVRRR